MNFSTDAYISNATVIIFIVPLAALLTAAAGILRVVSLSVPLTALLYTLVVAFPVVPRYVVLRQAFGFSE